MTAIDDVLWLLKDGNWHNIEEITQNIAITKPKTEMVISFLEEYDFIQLNKQQKSKFNPQNSNSLKESDASKKQEPKPSNSF